MNFPPLPVKFRIELCVSVPPPCKAPETQLTSPTPSKSIVAVVGTSTLLVQFKVPSIVPVIVPDKVIVVSQSMTAPLKTL